MAPPAGTSSMLRYRRRDSTLKPNRTLDRSASRGMLYENEELRLRTININAEVEKGQNYIKKLRRENEQLKREIWNLREEYERLENYVKSREQSEEEDEGGGDEFGNEEVVKTQPRMTETMADSVLDTVPTMAATVLETVVEEDDECSTVDDPQRPEFDETTVGDSNNGHKGNSDDPRPVNIDGDNRDENECGDNSDVVAVVVPAALGVAVAAAPEGVHAVTAAPVALTAVGLAATDSGHPDVGGDRQDDVIGGGGGGGSCAGQRQQDHHQEQQQDHHHHHRRRRLEVYDYNCAADDDVDGGRSPRGLRPHPDDAVLQPHTACFDTGSNRQLHDLTVDEVVNAIQDAELRDKLRTVSLTDDRCFMTFANAECLERALHTAVLRIRDVSVLLMDTGAGAIILSLTGVPDIVSNKEVLKCLKRYGTIIGGVERKTSRGGTTGGERYVRIRPTLGAPRYLWFGSDKVVVRQLTEHEAGTMNSVARRKSFRSQIKLNLKMADAHRMASAVAAAVGQSSSPTGEARKNCVGGDGPAVGGSGGGTVGGSGGGAVGGSGGGAVGGSGVESFGVGVGSTATTTVSVQNGFRFPSQDPKPTTGGSGGPTTEPCRTAPAVGGTGKPQPTGGGGGSTKKAKPPDSCAAPASASSAGPTESSPLRGRRRPSLMGFRRDTVKYRGGSVSRVDGGGGEDADSDTSPVCRRKLSIKSHERTEKVPWCGCWGNGCL